MKPLLQADLRTFGLFKNISPVVMLFSVYLLCPLSACADRVVISSGTEYSVSSVIENEVNTSSYGGAIRNYGTLTTSAGAEFNSNQGYYGGAIFNESTANIYDTTFTSNTASTYGGAIYNTADGTLTVTNSTFTSNIATNYYGGAIANLGETDILNSTFTSNSAQYGGALFNYNEAEISNSTFSENTASYYGGAIANTADIQILESVFESNSGSYGGAIFNQGALTITGGSFTKNSATYLGGAIYSSVSAAISGAAFSENTAKYGGAVYNAGTTEITGSSFTGNTASTSGGAIYNRSSGTLQITDSTFTSNTAGTYGGAIINLGQTEISDSTLSSNSAAYGGAVFNQSSLTIDSSEFDQNSASQGGAVYNALGTAEITDSTFTNNTADYYGGAIINFVDMTVSNSTFTSNSSGYYGGAIYNAGNAEISGSTFTGNSAYEYGGAIFNAGALTSVKDSEFTSNSAYMGGAIAHLGTTALTIDNVVFDSNTAVNNDDEESACGGAIFVGFNSYDEDTDTYTSAGDVTITNSVFTGNSADRDGGAIWQTNNSDTAISIYNSTFTNNTAGVQGGAIASDSYLYIVNSTFTGNSTTEAISSYVEDGEEDTSWSGGGAIFMYDESNTVIENSTFTNNSSNSYGGAIASRLGASSEKSSLTISNSTFIGNTATIYGGAIACAVDTEITNSDFTDNSAGEAGGAIYTAANLTINSDGYMSVFSGNSTSAGGDLADNAIYVGDSDATLTFNLSNGGSVYMEDSINGEEGYDVVIEGDDKESTTFYLLNDIYNANVYFAGTTINTINDAVYVYDLTSLTISGDTNMAADVDLANLEMDRFTASSYGSHSGTLNVSDMNLISDSAASSVSIYFAEEGLKDYVTGGGTYYTSIYKYLVSYDNRDDGGYFVFSRGSGYDSLNPSIMASPVAAQMGGYLVQLNSYDEAFRNMDMYMLMPKKQRMAMKMKNKYAVNSPVFDISLEREDKNYSGWARPYTTFEKVPLNNGPKVSNVAYGSFFGDESDIIDLGHGWDGVWGVYAGYNGSHQSYDGVGIWQNGGTLGLVGMAYKGSFFTGLTANVGASAGEANSSFGKDDFTMLMAGVASKTGYNFEFADGKFVIQPQLLLSYSFVNTFDYTNASGVHMSSDPLHAIQIEPGVKFIGNLKNGWQPYLGVSVVWNIMDKTHFMANDVTLPNLSVDPFVKYGAGVRKSWGERLVGYFQTYITNGGRNGVGLQAGFKFSLGKTKSPQPTMHQPALPKLDIMGAAPGSARGNLPELKKTDFRLNNIK